MSNFHVASTSHTPKTTGQITWRLFKKVIFPYLDQIKEKMVHPKEQMSLVVKDTFNGRDNNDLREPSARNNREIVVTLRNLTNKFQQIDLNVNKAAEAYVSLCWQIEFQNSSKEA